MRRRLPSRLGLLVALALVLGITVGGWADGALAEETNQGGSPVVSTVNDTYGIVPGEAILTFENPADAERVLASAAGSDTLDAEVIADDLGDATIVVVDYANESQAASLIAAANALPGVEAQPNYVYRLPKPEAEALDEASEPVAAQALTNSNASMDATADSPSDLVASDTAALAALPNDSLLERQHYLNPVNTPGASGSNILAAWSLLVSRQRSPVTVAVIDSGVLQTHEDLQRNIRIDYAYDFYNDSRRMTDEDGHGTTVTGVIVADANNGRGIAGVASGADAGQSSLVRVLPLKIFGSSEQTNTSLLIRAVDYLDDLVESGQLTDLRVVNISSGGYPEMPNVSDRAFHSSLNHLTNAHDVLCVGSADNDGAADYTTPSDYACCLGVASLSPSGAHSDFTNYNEYKDISAPGERIATTGITGPELDAHTYSYMSGTSFSAPITSAVAALMYSVYPDLDPYEAMAIIKQTAAPLPDPWTNYHASMGSAGALDARAAIERTIALSQGSSVVPEPVDPTPVDPNPNPVVPEPVDPIPVDPEPVDPEPVDPSPEFPEPDEPGLVTPVFRLYNPYATEHLLTTDPAEYLLLGLMGWNQEDVAFFLPERSAIPIYRLYNDWNGDHFFTTSLTEYNRLGREGWRQEGVKLCGAVKSATTTPVFRVYNPYMTANGGAFNHLWTSSYTEYQRLLGLGWRGEGVSWYAL